MPMLMNMKMDGVSGDSKSFSHKGWFEVLSWNWGMTSNRKSAHDTGSDKTSLNEISVIKSIGCDSADIRLLFAQGKVIPAIEFTVIPEVSKKEAKAKYIDIKIENAVIKSIITGGALEDSFFKEHITILFEKISIQFTRTSARSAGVADTAPVVRDFSWNVVENAEWKN